MNVYRLPACPDAGDAPLFDYAAEAERKQRVVRRVRAACAAVLAPSFAVYARDAGFVAAIRPWLPLLIATALATSLLVLAYQLFDRHG